jgi:Ca2+-binding RTX toxin-like protein
LTGIEDVQGGNFDDHIVGDANANGLYGDFGNDELYGGGGVDTLEGGGDADTLTGDSGDDIFLMKAIWANGDVISDFEGANVDGGDVLHLQDYGPGAKLSNAGDDFWQVNWSDGTDTFQISGVTTLDSSDYLFV